jgi:prepilin peptidase CpaA
LELLFLLSVAATVVFLIASYHDIRHRSIPNTLPIAVAAVAVVKWLLIGQLTVALWALAAAAAAFVITAIMFTQGWIGGGDVKLISAAIFFLGAPAAPDFLLLTALIGGVIALLILLGLGRARQRPAVETGATPATAEVPTIPYGVAIAAAAIAVIALGRHGAWPA